jgi:hypothetical protein
LSLGFSSDMILFTPFYINLPDNNIWNESPHTPYLAVADGWYLMLKPLSPGKHILHYTIGYKSPFAAVGGANQEGYIQDVTYNLIVKPKP